MPPAEAPPWSTGSRAEVRATWIGVVLVLISTATFGATPAVITLLRGEMPLVDVITYRGLLAGAMLMCLSLAVHRPADANEQHSIAPPSRPTRRYAGFMVGAALYAPQLILFYSAFDHIGTSLAVALGYIYPTIVIFLLAVRTRRLPRLSELVVASVALVGILALTDPGSAAVDPTGVYLVFAASFLYASYVVLAGDLVADQPPLRVGGQVSFGVGVAVGAYGLMTGHLGVPDVPSQWGALAVQAAMLVTGVATYYLGLVRLGASTTSLVDCAQPLFALMAGGWLLGERLVALQLAGVVLVSSAVAMTAVLAQRQATLPYADPP